MIKTYKFILTIAIFNCNFLHAQDSIIHKPTHSVYLELGGANHIGYSVNYEIIIRDYKNREYAFRLGGSILPYYANGIKLNSTLYAFPIEILLLIGKINKSSIELGAGVSFYFGDRSYNTNEGTKYPPSYVHFYNNENLFFQLGYRFHSNIKHIIFRLDFTYIILTKFYDTLGLHDSKSQPWLGLSVGYCF